MLVTKNVVSRMEEVSVQEIRRGDVVVCDDGKQRMVEQTNRSFDFVWLSFERQRDGQFAYAMLLHGEDIKIMRSVRRQ